MWECLCCSTILFEINWYQYKNTLLFRVFIFFCSSSFFSVKYNQQIEKSRILSTKKEEKREILRLYIMCIFRVMVWNWFFFILLKKKIHFLRFEWSESIDKSGNSKTKIHKHTATYNIRLYNFKRRFNRQSK